jgi:histidinol dehydrogenase
MKIFTNPKKEDWSVLLQRPTQSVEDIEKTVNQIFQDVQLNGDFAVSKYTSKFDGVKLDEFIVSEEEIKEASKHISNPLKEAILNAKRNIKRFHKAQKSIVLS